MNSGQWTVGARRLLLTIAALGAIAGAQVIGGGGGNGNATKLQGVPITKSAPSDGTCLVYSSSTGQWQASSCAGTASTAWSAVTSGTNTAAAMVVGTGASLAASGSGTIAATSATALAATPSQCTSGQFSTGVAASGAANCATPAAAPVASVFGRTGAVTAASGDYNFSQISGTATAAQLPARSWVCNAGLGDGLNAIPAGTYVQDTCYNGTGSTVTLTQIGCYINAGTSSTMNAWRSDNVDLLTGAVTCGQGYDFGTLSSTITIPSGEWVSFQFVADGTAKQSGWVVIGTY